MFPSPRTSKEDRKVCNKLSEFLVTGTKGACSWPKSPKVCLLYKGLEIVLDPETAEEIS